MTGPHLPAGPGGAVALFDPHARIRVGAHGRLALAVFFFLSSCSSRPGPGRARGVRRPAPVPAEHADAQAAARLVGTRLERRLTRETGVHGAAQAPDVDFRVDDAARLDVEELGRAVRHGGVFGRGVLDREGERARRDGRGRRAEGAEVHEDGRAAVVREHDVARLYVAVRVGAGLTWGEAGLGEGDFAFHQGLVLFLEFGLVVCGHCAVLSAGFLAAGGVRVRVGRLLSD